jgi:hypothetical protein
MPRNGDYGLTHIGGLVGLFVSIGQVLMGDASRFTHAFIVVNADEGIAVEARPRGAGYVNYRDRYARRFTMYSHQELTDAQRCRIVAAAESFVGRGYNWFDYLALAFVRIGVKSRRLDRYIASTDRLICSQLVDQADLAAGVHLFNDGRGSQNVSPGDLTYVGHIY